MTEERKDLLDDNFGVTTEEKKRHGCVTAWLVLLIAVNAITALAYLLGGSLIADSLPTADMDPWMLPVMAILGIANVIFAVMLFQWKKMGFWGFVATSLLALVVNLMMGIGIIQSLLGLIGIGVLFAILQIREDEVPAWDHLE